MNPRLAALELVLEDAKKLAEKVVKKVETGKMHSIETYADCKALLIKIKKIK